MERPSETKCTQRRLGAHDENGFTLVELLIVVVILPLVVGAIAMGLVAVFTLQTGTSQRLSGSTDLQVVTATFVRDVESSSVITNTTTQVCGSTGGQLLGLSMSGASVSYVSVPISNGTKGYTNALERLYCSLNSSTPTVPTVTVISSELMASQAAPQICDLTWTCSNASATKSATQVAAVKFSVPLPMSTVSSYVMVASPRAGFGTIASTSGPVLRSPLTLLGATCGSNLLSVGNGNLTIEVGGQPGTLGLANCPASSVTLANNGNIYASGIFSGTTSTTPINGNSALSTFPTTVYTDTGIVNPFSALTPSLVPQATSPALNACPKSGSTYTCSPGLYSSLSFSNNSTVNFTGGTYSFSSDFYLPNGTNAFFGPGTYSFNAPDSNAFNTGTNGVAITGSNVLFYSPSGSITFRNNSTVSLSNQSLNGGTYMGVTIWDNAVYSSVTGVGAVTLGNNSSQVNGYGGIYVPYGTVIDNNNGTISTSFIVSGTASFANGLNVIINLP